MSKLFLTNETHWIWSSPSCIQWAGGEPRATRIQKSFNIYTFKHMHSKHCLQIWFSSPSVHAHTHTPAKKISPEHRKWLFRLGFLPAVYLDQHWDAEVIRRDGLEIRNSRHRVVRATGEWANRSVIFCLSQRVVCRWCAATSSLTSCLNMSTVTMLTISGPSCRDRSAARSGSYQPSMRSNVSAPSHGARSSTFQQLMWFPTWLTKAHSHWRAE